MPTTEVNIEEMASSSSPPVEREMVVCEISWDEIPINEAIDCWDNRYIKNSYLDRRAECDICKKIYCTDNEWTEVVWWEIVCNVCRDEEYFECVDCWDLYPNDNRVEISNWDVVCQDCADHDYSRCYGCDELFHNDDLYSHWWNLYCEDCESDLDEDDASIVSWRITTTVSDEKLPEQKPYEAPTEIQQRLEDFYAHLKSVWKFTFYKRKPFEHKTFISLKSDLAYKMFRGLQKWVYSDITSIYYNTFKYAKATIMDSVWVQIRYEYTDLMWKRKLRTESIFTVRNYYKKLLWDKFTMPKPNKNDFTKDCFDIEMSNEGMHKLALAKANNKAFCSCQNSNNVHDYAKGLRDWFNNDCNIPIAIKKDWNIVGRQLIRLFIDKNWKEYIFLDRLYLSDDYWNYKKILYVEIAKRLRTMYDLAVPTHSEHDNSVKDYLDWEFHEKFITNDISLRQPTRWYWEINRAYYNDSWTMTYSYNGKLYDKIKDNRYICLLNKK